jgi:hypothetical protein
MGYCSCALTSVFEPLFHLYFKYGGFVLFNLICYAESLAIDIELSWHERRVRA